VRTIVETGALNGSSAITDFAARLSEADSKRNAAAIK
jgi:hypothetical protein